MCQAISKWAGYTHVISNVTLENKMEPSYPEELNHIFLQQGKSSLILSFGKNQEQNKNM